ncbi:hypothetical protein H0H93_006504 [Arthromyces matolae]|nr:hypothetical protein H0H93_006504 [Arthromyces matolae]
MPVPTNLEVSGPPKPTSQPSQKSMTKAERRELQERQRAAKLAQKSGQADPTTGKDSTLPKPPKTPSTQQKKSGDASGSGAAKSSQAKEATTATTAAMDDNASVSRGLRIFSHFGLPKPLGHTIKGDIHPEVIRLGLLFSEFRICGSNARCIATLTAFKSITHLVSARPMSVTMGNAIRQLKLDISKSNIDMIEQDVGKALLRNLVKADPPIPCTYALLPALPSLMTQVTTVLLGAHSLSANGAVYSRAGTALVAMIAKTHSVPVMVCCETYKFSEGVMLDGFGKNELGKTFSDFNLKIFKPNLAGSPGTIYDSCKASADFFRTIKSRTFEPTL